MSNFADNIIDQSGQQVFLEDKHLNDQTSQTTVATTDAVMLKDTNGAYHSIDKGSFNEAVRAAMGPILTNFDKGTSITRIPGIDSSNDLGSVTAANLASVLGVPIITNGSNNTTFNIGNITATSSIRLLGSDFDPSRGVIDFTIYGNGGNITVRGSVGSSGHEVKVYKKDTTIYLYFPSGISINFISTATKIKQETLPGDATQLTVSPY